MTFLKDNKIDIFSRYMYRANSPRFRFGMLLCSRTRGYRLTAHGLEDLELALAKLNTLVNRGIGETVNAENSMQCGCLIYGSRLFDATQRIRWRRWRFLQCASDR